MPPKSQVKAVKSKIRISNQNDSSLSGPGSDDSVLSKRRTKSKVPSKKSDVKKVTSTKLAPKNEKDVKKEVKPPTAPTPQKDETSSEGIADELGITKGTVIVEKDKGCKYVVLKVLGEGGFGAVLDVYKEGKENEQHYAMKVEKRGRKHNKLKMEIAILKMIGTARSEGKLPEHTYSPHFTEMFGRGRMETYVFLVMELVGKSLNDLKTDFPKKVFSIGTAIFAAKQCLEAVQDLHELNFIHRDLKPANYAIGAGKKIRTIYILDFGISRRIVNDLGKLKTPRAFVGFKGTVRFASRGCHHNMDLSFRDDCESWFYLLLDLIVEGGLPWRRLDDKDVVRDKKEECLQKKDYCPADAKYAKQFNHIMTYIASLSYESRLDYDFIYKSMDSAAKLCGIPNLNEIKLDWEK